MHATKEDTGQTSDRSLKPKAISKSATPRDLAVLALIGISVYVASKFIPILDNPLLGDAIEYYTLAVKHVNGGEFSIANYWPPGLPLLLVGIFEIFHSTAQNVAQNTAITITVLTGFFIYLLILEWISNRRVAFWAAIAFYVYPTTVLLAVQTESHVLCALLVTAGAYFIVKFCKTQKIYYSAIVSLLIGILVLVRPGSIALLIVCAGAPVIFLIRPFSQLTTNIGVQRAVLHMVVVIIGFSAITAPFFSWNHSHGGGWTISTNNERNFFLGNNKYTHPYKTGHLAWHSIESLPEETQQYLNDIYNSDDPRPKMLSESYNFIVSSPWQFTIRTFNRFKNYWTFEYEAGRRIQAQKAALGIFSWLPTIAQALSSTLLIAAFLFSLQHLYRHNQQKATISILIVCVLYQLPHIIAFSSPVYRTGLTPLFFVFSSVGIYLWRRKTEDASSIEMRSPWKGLLVGSILYTWINLEAGYFLLRLS
jgi:Dolichyl-phosphate-mannose-protein mannosyltransferase